MPILHKVPHCRGVNCTSIGYFILGEQADWITPVMQKVAVRNSLAFGQDVKMLLRTNSPTMISNYLMDHLNQTQIAIVFCTDKWAITDNIFIPCKFENYQKELIFYTILYNYTLLYKTPYLSDQKQPYPKDAMASSLKISLDNALL
jgi:hypothetical protein